MNPSIVNFGLFQVAWFACALGVGKGMPVVSMTILCLVLGIHLYTSRHRQRDAFFLSVTAVTGTLTDSALGLTGILNFQGQWFCPPWLTGLWMAFGSTIHYSLSWLRERPLLAAFLGAVGGPASYYAGARFGALQLGSNTVVCLAVLAFSWGLIMPLLLSLSNGKPKVFHTLK